MKSFTHHTRCVIIKHFSFFFPHSEKYLINKFLPSGFADKCLIHEVTAFSAERCALSRGFPGTLISVSTQKATLSDYGTFGLSDASSNRLAPVAACTLSAVC